MSSKIGVSLLIVIFLTALSSGSFGAIQNLVNNSDFENGTEGWSIGADYGSLAIDNSVEGIVGSTLYAKIDKLGANAWEPEIHSPDFALDMNKTYTVDFWAKTEAGKTRNLMVKFEQLDVWGGPSGTVTIDDQWKPYNMTGVADFQSPPNSVIHIQFEGSVDDIWFSHFRVYQGDYVPEILTPVSPVDRLSTAWGKIKIR